MTLSRGAARPILSGCALRADRTRPRAWAAHQALEKKNHSADHLEDSAEQTVAGKRTSPTLIDLALVAVVAAVAGAVAIPLIERGVHAARRSALRENLHVLRSQIELYRAEHGGQSPAVVNGSLPQLLRPTDRAGRMGDKGSRFPFGPYLRGPMPVNPITGSSIVTESLEYPFSSASGNGGWLYHPPTGRIAADLPAMLQE